MTSTVEVDVTVQGRDYFKHWFEGIPGLCARMLPVVEAQGSITALVPKGTSHDRALQFEAGGLEDFRPLSEWLFPRLVGKMKTTGSGILLNQDIWAKSSDLRPSDPPAMVSENPDAVFYFVTAENLSLSSLEACMWAPLSFVSALFVVPDCKLYLPQDRRVLQSAELDALASDVTEIVILAYDQESYLIWRQTTEPEP